MKKGKQILGWLLAAALALPGWQGASADELYQKVTSVDDISTEEVYVICQCNGEYGMTATANTSSGFTTSNPGKTNMIGDRLLSPDTHKPAEIQLVSVEGKSETYYLQLVSTGKYLRCTSKSSGNLASTDDISSADTYNDTHWQFVDNADGVQIKNVGTKLVIKNSSTVFSCKSSLSDKSCLFRKLTKAGDVVITKETDSYSSFVTLLYTDYDITEVDGLKAYIVTEAGKTGVTMSAVDQIPRGTPVVLSGMKGHYISKEVSGVAKLADNLLKEGSSSTKSDGKTYYALASLSKGIGFYLVAENIKIPSGKVYLEIKDAGAKDFIGLFEDDGVTGISGTEAARPADGGFYSLQGIRLPAAPSRKGIYLHRGKKIIIK